MRRLLVLISGGATAALALAGAAFSQGTAGNFPSKPVTMIVPLAAGGANDIESRIYTPKMSGLMGQPFLVDYKPGAATTIGVAYVAKAVPDGHTLLATSGSFTVSPALYKNLPFDNIRDFAPVSLMSKRTTALVVHPSFPARTFPEYIAYARANPGKINWGTSGQGGITHLAGAWLHGLTNTKVTFVHYKATATLHLDLAAGRIDVNAGNLLVVLPAIKSGKLRALAIAGDTRSKDLPDLPSIVEQGMPEYNYANWMGIIAPGATPVATVNKLSEAFAAVARMRDVIAAIEADGGVTVGSTPAQFRELLVSETARWRKVVQEHGIMLEE